MIYYREKTQCRNAAHDHEAALQLLTDALKEEYGIHTLPVILIAENGKPYFQDHPAIHFNYSHSAHYVACGLSDQEIGIDVEEIRPIRDSLIGKVCHDNERRWIYAADDTEIKNERFIMLWTMKEAYLKQKGTGIRSSLRELDFSQLLLQGGSGQLEDGYMMVRRLKNAYLSVYASETYNLLQKQIIRDIIILR